MNTEQALERLQASLIEYAFNCGHSCTFPADLDALAAIRQQFAALEAECARLRGSIEAAARYGWEHDRWQWSAVKGGLDRFTDAALRGKESGDGK